MSKALSECMLLTLPGQGKNPSFRPMGKWRSLPLWVRLKRDGQVFLSWQCAGNVHPSFVPGTSQQKIAPLQRLFPLRTETHFVIQLNRITRMCCSTLYNKYLELLHQRAQSTQPQLFCVCVFICFYFLHPPTTLVRFLEPWKDTKINKE